MRLADVLLPLLILASTAIADEPRPRTITTTGTASAYVVPDRAELRVQLLTEDTDIAKAKKLNDDAASELLEFLHKTGIEEKDIQATLVRSQPKLASRMDGKLIGTVIGFRVSRHYSINLRDISKLSAVYDRTLPDPRISLFGEVLSTSEIRKYADEARLEAVKVAREKANLLANSLDATVGPAREVTEDADDVAESRIQSARGGLVFSGGVSEDNAPIGLVEVKASVTVVFDLIPNVPAK